MLRENARRREAGEFKVAQTRDEIAVDGETPTTCGVLDLLVVGAGPHALSLLTRLVDDEPDLLTELERSKLMHQARRARSRAVVREHLERRYDASKALPRTLVVDSHGQWMAQWKNNFEALGIQYLRSHTHLHPCPFDYESMSLWVAMERRRAELKQMRHVDRKAWRSKGYNGPYHVPGTQLFLDFCASLVDRYNLAPLVQRGTVADVRILDPSPTTGGARTFEVRLDDGRRFVARHVVCSMGPGPAFQAMRATLPWWVDELTASLSRVSGEDNGELIPKEKDVRARVQHSSALTAWLLDRDNDRLLSGHRVLVVGGGQTAAHLAHLAICRGASSVTLCARRHIIRKPYDVDIEYMGARRPNVLKEFWRLKDPRKRMEFNAALRGGGSISDDKYWELRECNECSSRLVLAEDTTVVQGHWHSTVGGDGEIHVRFDDGNISHFDFVWLATGGNLDLDLVPIFASLQEQHPIASVDGLPALRKDLSWAEGVPLYVMGAFAQLQLGADALNLAGARSGGVIVARALLASL
ncbi:unnamed protein product [Discosporangium mesarthrocarpum]